MPRCNTNRCAFLGNPCVGSLSDCYCADRLTPKQCEKEMKKEHCTTKEELWFKRKNKQ